MAIFLLFFNFKFKYSNYLLSFFLKLNTNLNSKKNIKKKNIKKLNKIIVEVHLQVLAKTQEFVFMILPNGNFSVLSEVFFLLFLFCFVIIFVVKYIFFETIKF